MATNQGLRHAAALSIASASGLDYNSAFMAMFDVLGITAVGTFNGRMLAFCNDQLVASHTNLDTAMNAFAVAQGAPDWDGLGTFTAS